MTPTHDPAGSWSAESERERELDSVTARVVGQLRACGVELTGRESTLQLSDMQTAVERFESAVSEAGGDRMITTGRASRAEDEPYVLPKRAADESPGQYADRVLRAARRLVE
ncbi:MAG TPA: hypothetical protein VN677_01895 [Gemmatimonadaceae bacterium]|jgi:hypothetical protein|nr:hypothetical protein [Gemmatimonadaceae bacterium]